MNPVSLAATPAPSGCIAGTLDRLIGALTETAVALLVVAEVVILFSGVAARYVFHEPLIWSDELASLLFLSLAMLGSVVALRRSEHMRMTAVVSMVSPERRAFLEVFAVTASLAFLLIVLWPAYKFARDGRIKTATDLAFAISPPGRHPVANAERHWGSVAANEMPSTSAVALA